MDLNKFYDKFYNWVLSTGPRLIMGIAVVLIGWWAIKLIKKRMMHRLHKHDMEPSFRPFLTNLLIITLQVLLVIGFMQIVGIQMTIFTAVIGAFGVAAGLALSGTLQNFTSGILILLLKPFRVGDNIIAQGQEGTVESIQIFFTYVKTYDNRTIVVPNSKLSNEIIINLNLGQTRRMDIEMKFDFSIPFEAIKRSMERTVHEEKGFLQEPAHRIGVSGIESDGYKVMINVWVPPHGFVDIKLKFQEQLINNLKRDGIKLPGL
jgi:small conductance mechanosensitive channel